MSSQRVLLAIGVCAIGLAAACTVPTSPTPAPTATVGPRPVELADTRWGLDHVLVNGDKQPAYHPSQCLKFRAVTDYSYYNGCNYGHCTDAWRWTPSPPKTKQVFCEETVQLCTQNMSTGERKRVPWDQPFSDAIRKYAWSELRDGYLWWHTSLDGDVILVFSPLTDLCPGESNW